MAAIAILLGISFILAWFGFELRDRRPDVAHVLFGLSALFMLFLGAAFFGIIGG